VRLHRFLRVQIENNFLWTTSWVLKGALTGLPTAFDNNLRYFRRYLKINTSENLFSMRFTALFVIPASAPTDRFSTCQNTSKPADAAAVVGESLTAMPKHQMHAVVIVVEALISCH
jgi:hypothetical protein